VSGKYALIIGNTEYIDSGLAQLTAPGKDAEDFASVLKDQEICAFDKVNILLNQLSSTIIEAIDEFFDQKKPDDLLVLYFSGHGVRDELGALYLAVKNTIRSRLRSTAIKSDYIRDAMNQSRSKRQVVVLDCCNSGAFSQGMKAEIGGTMGMVSAFQGYGRYVLTASDEIQFAWEGNKIIGETENSLFTHFLLKGLKGEADSDSDGRITVDELYDYAYEQISRVTPKQTPRKDASKQEGEIVLRQNMRIEDIKPVPLPTPVLDSIENPFSDIRLGAVQQLIKFLNGKNLGLAHSAREALEKMAAEDDSFSVRQAANRAMESIRQAEQLAHQKAEEERLAAEKAEVGQRASEEQLKRAEAKTEKADSLRKGLRVKKEREVAPRYVYVIVEDGTPLYHSLPSSNNWTVWLEEGSPLAILESMKDAKLSIGKSGHYIEVADNQGNKGFVTATAVSFEQPSRQSIESKRKSRSLTEEAETGQEITSLSTELGRIAQSDGGIWKFSIKKLLSWPLGMVSLVAIFVILSVFIWKVQNQNQAQDSERSILIAALEKNVNYFTSDSLGKEEIYVLTANGQITQVTRTPKQYQSWSPAPDGHGNLYFTSNQSGKTEIYVLTVDGRISQVTQTPKQYQSWSPAPDGHGNLYFTSNQSGKTEIYVLTANGQITQVTRTPKQYQSWSPAPDGHGNLYFTSNQSGKTEIYVLTANGQLSQVTQTPKQYQSWSPAPDGDGNLYFTSNQSGKTEIYVVTSNGRLSQVTQTPKQYQSWSPAPDGHGNLYFTSNQNEKSKIYILTTNGKVQPISLEISGGNWTGTIKERDPRSER